MQFYACEFLKRDHGAMKFSLLGADGMGDPGGNVIGLYQHPDLRFCISKSEVWKAYKRVKANKGATGVDEHRRSPLFIPPAKCIASPL